VGSDEVVDLDEFRLKRGKTGNTDDLVACCMNCGAEYPWGKRFDHNCQREESRRRHPCNQT